MENSQNWKIGTRLTVFIAFIAAAIGSAALAHHGTMNEAEKKAAENAEKNLNMESPHCYQVQGSDGKTHMVCYSEKFLTPRQVGE